MHDEPASTEPSAHSQPLRQVWRVCRRADVAGSVCCLPRPPQTGAGDRDTRNERHRTAGSTAIARDSRVRKRLSYPFNQRRRVSIEGHADLMGPGGHRHPGFESRRAREGVRLTIRPDRPECKELNLLAVDANLQLMRLANPACPRQSDIDLVGGILGKEVRDGDPATRTKRQPVHSVVLLKVLRIPVGLRLRRRWVPPSAIRLIVVATER